MRSTREQIIIERKTTNKPPCIQIVTKKPNQFFNPSLSIRGNRKTLLKQSRELAYKRVYNHS